MPSAPAKLSKTSTAQRLVSALKTSLDQLLYDERSVDLVDLLDALERHGISTALAKHKGNRTHAAGQLRMNRTSLLAKMRRFNVVAHKETMQ